MCSCTVADVLGLQINLILYYHQQMDIIIGAANELISTRNKFDHKRYLYYVHALFIYQPIVYRKNSITQPTAAHGGVYMWKNDKNRWVVLTSTEYTEFPCHWWIQPSWHYGQCIYCTPASPNDTDQSHVNKSHYDHLHMEVKNWKSVTPGSPRVGSWLGIKSHINWWKCGVVGKSLACTLCWCGWDWLEITTITQNAGWVVVMPRNVKTTVHMESVLLLSRKVTDNAQCCTSLNDNSVTHYHQYMWKDACLISVRLLY